MGKKFGKTTFVDTQRGESMNKLVHLEDVIEVVRKCSVKEVTPAYMLIDKAEVMAELMMLPFAQPETYKEKLNEIASALSEKFAYMNTCPNERDIILGYLGVRRCCNTHCNTDCTNTKCESHPLSSAQPEIIHCRDCKHRGEEPIADGRYWCEIHDTFMYYCSDAERRTDEESNIS